ncbi:MAG: hypothetical protein J6I40_07020, partial [Mailhella sp.]|nr:hypothetical protein [Mailhella sp.]
VRHLRPLTLDSSPIGRAWLSDAGRSRWRMEFEIRDGLDVCCLGWQKGCYYSLVSRKPVPFPNDFLDVCKRFLADGSAGIQNGAC